MKDGFVVNPDLTDSLSVIVSGLVIETACSLFTL